MMKQLLSRSADDDEQGILTIDVSPRHFQAVLLSFSPSISCLGQSCLTSLSRLRTNLYGLESLTSVRWLESCCIAVN